MQTGADEEKVREVPTWRESARFSSIERAALEYAEAMTITGQRVGDDLFARVRSFFDEAQIVELTVARWRSRTSAARRTSRSRCKPRAFAPFRGCRTRQADRPPRPQGSFAGLENGLVASSTNITSAWRSTEPLLDTCIGVSAPCAMCSDFDVPLGPEAQGSR
jgi:hypothetical protein